ncbi:MAG: zinc ribbon domain-containing protein [Lachnospira sp.]
MFCPNCGTQNEDDAVFCANCGTALASDTSAPATDAVQTASVDNSQAAQEQPQQPQFGGQPQQPQFGGQPQQPQFGGQPQQPQFGGQPQYNAQPQAPKEKKPFKISGAIIGAAIAVVVVIAAIVAFVCIGKSNTDYKKTAKKYVKAVEQCDWNTAYSLMNIPDSEFLTKEALAKVNQDATGEAVTSMTVNNSFSTIGNLPGNKAVTVTYQTPTGFDSEELILTKSSKKYMLFFNKYLVSSDSFVVKDCTISVPKGLTLYINDIQVSESYKSSDNSSSSTDKYIIPFLFEGTNELKVTGDMVEDYTKTTSFDYDEDSASISASSLTIDSGKVSSLQSQAEKDLKTIVDAVIAKKDFSTISSICNSSAKSTCQSKYNSLTNSLSSSYTWKSGTLSNVKTSIYTTKYTLNSDGKPTVRVTVGYSLEEKYTTSTSTEERTRTRTASSSSYYIEYVLDNGTWLINTFSLYM